MPEGRELFELMVRVVSGEKTKSEELGFGGVEFVPWQIGAVMERMKKPSRGHFTRTGDKSNGE